MRMGRIGGVVLGLGIASLAPRAAEACGGTFCDTGGVPVNPQQPPKAVDQSGENILFVLHDGQVEAHVQIQYTGNPARFAWIVPMPAIPDVKVGSQILFTQMLNASVPTYGTTTSFDTCDNTGVSSNSSSGCGSSDMSSDTAGDATFAPNQGGTGAGGGSGLHNGVDVLVHETVGAFDVTVLKGQSLDEITSFLSTNGYYLPDTAPPLLQGYLEKGFYFVAVRLTPGEGVSEIHPLVFTYPGQTPCVPLRLTAVAAVEDMSVRAFFLGSARILPSTYKHVVLNETRIDWSAGSGGGSGASGAGGASSGLGSNYDQVVSQAMNSPLVDGRGFVTEYAGPTSVVQRNGVFDPKWIADSFRASQPEDVVEELFNQGLLSCSSEDNCVAFHPLVFPLLETYLPAPPGIPEKRFYSALKSYRNLIDLTIWDAQKFADDFDTRIVQPGKHASDILDQNPYLTRLFTKISPAEMTSDPEFVERSDLPTVTQTHSSVLRTSCNQKLGMEVEDGRSVGLASASAWPDLGSMPYAERVEDVPASGPVHVLVDNRQTIDDSLASYNNGVAWPPQPSFGVQQNTGSSTCGCQIPAMRSTPGVFSLLAALGLLRRRWRRSERPVLDA